MAVYQVYQAKHATLSGFTVDTVRLMKTGGLMVRVINRSAVEALTFVIGRGTVPDPILLGDNLDVVQPGAVQDTDLEHYDRGDGTIILRGYAGGSVDPIIVKLIGNGNAYSVMLAR